MNVALAGPPVLRWTTHRFLEWCRERRDSPLLLAGPCMPTTEGVVAASKIKSGSPAERHDECRATSTTNAVATSNNREVVTPSPTLPVEDR